MLAPFPRTSVYPTIRKQHKNNKKLGKVSYQMQKIIEDIQGSKSEKADGDVQRKRVNVRETEAAVYHERSQRRKSRRTRETEHAFKEMACQTSLLITSEEYRHANRKSQVCTQKLPMDNDSFPSHRKDTKASNIAGNSNRIFNPHWKRPLPPVPEAINTPHQTQSQANLYQKVFETLKDKLNADSVNIGDSGRCLHNRCTCTSLSCVQRKTLSKQVKEMEMGRDVGFSRYVDIDVISEKKKGHQTSTGIKTQGPSRLTSRTSVTQHDNNDDDEHIYESIDENSDYDLDPKAVKCRELFPASPVTNFSKSLDFSPSFVTPHSLRTFSHEETYLEPICPLNNLDNYKKTAPTFGQVQELSDKSRNASTYPDYDRSSAFSGSSDAGCTSHLQCLCPIADFQYSRDFAGSPTWSSHSASEESVSLKAIYV